MLIQFPPLPSPCPQEDLYKSELLLVEGISRLKIQLRQMHSALKNIRRLRSDGFFDGKGPATERSNAPNCRQKSAFHAVGKTAVSAGLKGSHYRRFEVSQMAVSNLLKDTNALVGTAKAGCVVELSLPTSE